MELMISRRWRGRRWGGTRSRALIIGASDAPGLAAPKMTWVHGLLAIFSPTPIHWSREGVAVKVLPYLTIPPGQFLKKPCRVMCSRTPSGQGCTDGDKK